MTQADSVHSTPPTNTSSRRSFLTQAAAVAAGSGTLGITLPLPGSASASERAADPIFEAIEAHKATRAAYSAAVGVHADIEEELLRDGTGVAHFDRCPRHLQAERDLDRAHNEDLDAACVLVSVLPTTMAGITALLRYAIDADKDGELWPIDLQDEEGRVSDSRPWHYFLVANPARAGAGRCSMSMDTQNCISSNVVRPDFRQICRTSTGTESEQVDPAHVQVLPFPKTAHARHSKAQRVAGLRGHALMDAVDKAVVTGENERLRAERKDAWLKAAANTDYFEALHEFLVRLQTGQRYGVADAVVRAPVDFERLAMAYDHYREALRDQLLTPAPDVALNEWKMRKIMSKRRERWDDATEVAIKVSINDDIEWLEAHPARQPKRKK